MRTRRTLGYLSAISCFLSLSAGMAFAQAPSIATNIDLAYVSKYIWRGTVQNPDPAFQPSVTIAHPSGASFNFWGSMNTTAGNSGNFTEEDYTLSYAWTAGGKAVSAGYIYYGFPNTTFASTQELYSSICFGGPLFTTLALNYDFDEANGLYGAVSTGYSCNLTPRKSAATTMNLSAKLGFATSGYNNFYFGVDKTSLVDLVLGASVPFQAGKMKITPSLSYSMVVNSELGDALSASGLEKNNFIGGLTLSSAF
ncbi:MAG: TorF family putative porin [Armatimonadota bacterium]